MLHLEFGIFPYHYGTSVVSCRISNLPNSPCRVTNFYIKSIDLMPHIDSRNDHVAVSNLKPIFHRLPNANEIDTNNMKSTWPTRAPTPGDPMQTIFHWFTLGPPARLRVGSARLRVWSTKIRYGFLNTNMKWPNWGPNH